MIRILLALGTALAACTPSPQENAMRSLTPSSGTPADQAGTAATDGEGAGVPGPASRTIGKKDRAALGPVLEPVPVTENPLPSPRADSRVEAEGRRTLSTAVVRVGPDGRLTVQLRNGRTLMLRNVVLRAKDYCGVLDDPSGARYCGGYAEVVAARPGDAPPPEEPAVSASNPAQR